MSLRLTNQERNERHARASEYLQDPLLADYNNYDNIKSFVDAKIAELQLVEDANQKKRLIDILFYAIYNIKNTLSDTAESLSTGIFNRIFNLEKKISENNESLEELYRELDGLEENKEHLMRYITKKKKESSKISNNISQTRDLRNWYETNKKIVNLKEESLYPNTAKIIERAGIYNKYTSNISQKEQIKQLVDSKIVTKEDIVKGLYQQIELKNSEIVQLEGKIETDTANLAELNAQIKTIYDPVNRMNKLVKSITALDQVVGGSISKNELFEKVGKTLANKSIINNAEHLEHCERKIGILSRLIERQENPTSKQSLERQLNSVKKQCSNVYTGGKRSKTMKKQKRKLRKTVRFH